MACVFRTLTPTIQQAAMPAVEKHGLSRHLGTERPSPGRRGRSQTGSECKIVEGMAWHCGSEPR